MKFDIKILLEARLQLRDIAAFHKLKVGPVSAEKITDRILDAIDKLADFPEMGAVPPSELLAKAGYRMLIVQEYLCFYHVEQQTIYVSHIVHGSTDYIKKLLGS